MINNGAAVALPPVLDEPPSAPATTATPGAAPAATAITIEIGAATASAVTAICFAAQELQQNGGLTNATKLANGERIAAVTQLKLANLGKIEDFNAVARAEGKRVLRQYLDVDFYRRYSAEQGDAALDLYIGDVLSVVDRVIAVEMAFRAN